MRTTERTTSTPMKTLLLAAALAGVALACPAAEAGRYLLENFTGVGVHPSENLAARTNRDAPRFGLGCLELRYDLARSNKAVARLDCRGREPGAVSFWVRGDQSNNRLRLTWRHSYVDDRGNVRDHRESFNHDVRLDFGDWRQFTAQSPKARDNAFLRLVMIEIFKDGNSQRASGTVMIDEMTVEVPARQYPGEARLVLPERLASPREKLAIMVDVRNYAANAAASCTLHARLLDSQGNRVGEMHRRWQAPPGSSTERQFAFDARLEDYIPPLEVSCEFVSAGLNADFSESRRVAMPVAETVLADFGQVQDLWRGGEARVDQYNELFEAPVILPDTVSQPAADVRKEGASGHMAGTVLRRVESGREFGRFALEWGYTLEGGQDAIFYAQSMEGAPVSMSVWVKGDGSGNRLLAGIRDWGRRIRGGGNRSAYYERHVCTLDFTGWKQFTFDLPGAGLGGYDPQGDPRNVDYPLEFVGFYVRHGGGECPASGTLQLGPLTLANQVKGSEAVGVDIAGGSDDGLYHAGEGAAVITVRNTHLVRSRKMRLSWVLRDASGADIAKGGAPVELQPASFKDIVVAFPKVEPDAAPFTLIATVRDTDDPAAVASNERIFSLPNAVFTRRFEVKRQFYTGFGHLFRISGRLAAPLPDRAMGPITEGGRACAPLNWAKKEDGGIGVSALLIAPALRGLPVTVSADVLGDGSGVVLYPVFAGGESGEDASAYFARNVIVGRPVRVDFTGWRRLSFAAPIVHKHYRDAEEFRPHMPVYPLNLFLAAAADGATKGTAGRLLIDDLRVETQIPPAERLRLGVRFRDASDFLPPDDPVALEVENCDLVGRRTVKLRGVIQFPDSTVVAEVNTSLELKSGEMRTITLVPEGLPRGAWWLSCTATDDRGGSAAIHRPLVVATPADFRPGMTWPDSFLARQVEPWPEKLIDDFSMRRPVGETRDTVRLDWDLLEPYPQMFDFGRLLGRLRAIRERGDTAHVMLGFAAFWAAGEGYEQCKRGAYNRPHRHIGYTTDYWHVPEKMEDWDNFIHHITREAGDLVDVWDFWDNPDVPGLIQLQPRQAVAMLGSLRRWCARYSPNSKIMLTGLRRHRPTTAPGKTDPARPPALHRSLPRTLPCQPTAATCSISSTSLEYIPLKYGDSLNTSTASRRPPPAKTYS